MISSIRPFVWLFTDSCSSFWTQWLNVLWSNMTPICKSIFASICKYINHFLYWAISWLGRFFCGSVHGFRQRAANWGSVLGCQFAAWEGTLISASVAKNEVSMCQPLREMGRGVDDVLITAVSPSLHPQTSRWATGHLLVGLVVSACCCSGKLRTVATFKWKAPH